MLGWHKRQAEVIQPSIRALGEDPQFPRGADDHRTLLYMLPGAELIFCRDHERRSRVTEVPASLAKVVFTGLPKPPHSNNSPSCSRICSYFQTSGVMLVESHGYLDMLEMRKTQRKRDCSPPLQLLMAEALR